VIGVKRVPQAERVGQHCHPRPEPLVMRGHHEREQMTNPATCRPAITPYIAVSLARSRAVIAANDCRASCPM